MKNCQKLKIGNYNYYLSNIINEGDLVYLQKLNYVTGEIEKEFGAKDYKDIHKNKDNKAVVYSDNPKFLKFFKKQLISKIEALAKASASDDEKTQTELLQFFWEIDLMEYVGNNNESCLEEKLMNLVWKNNISMAVFCCIESSDFFDDAIQKPKQNPKIY